MTKATKHATTELFDKVGEALNGQPLHAVLTVLCGHIARIAHSTDDPEGFLETVTSLTEATLELNQLGEAPRTALEVEN